MAWQHRVAHRYLARVYASLRIATVVLFRRADGATPGLSRLVTASRCNVLFIPRPVGFSPRSARLRRSTLGKPSHRIRFPVSTCIDAYRHGVPLVFSARRKAPHRLVYSLACPSDASRLGFTQDTAQRFTASFYFSGFASLLLAPLVVATRRNARITHV